MNDLASEFSFAHLAFIVAVVFFLFSIILSLSPESQTNRIRIREFREAFIFWAHKLNVKESKKNEFASNRKRSWMVCRWKAQNVEKATTLCLFIVSKSEECKFSGSILGFWCGNHSSLHFIDHFSLGVAASFAILIDYLSVEPLALASRSLCTSDLFLTWRQFSYHFTQKLREPDVEMAADDDAKQWYITKKERRRGELKKNASKAQNSQANKLMRPIIVIDARPISNHKCLAWKIFMRS